MSSQGVYPTADVCAIGDEISSTYEGRHVTLYAENLEHGSIVSFVTKGYPVWQNNMVGVAFNTQADGENPLIAIDTEGIWCQDVKGENDDGNVGIDPGDALYVNTATGLISGISDESTQLPFGYALGTVGSGLTERIAVKVHWNPLTSEVVVLKGVQVADEWSVAGVRGRPFATTLTIHENTLLGNYANAIKGYVICEDGAGSIGLVSAVNCEILMPDSACAGAYYPLEIEYVDQASTAFGIPGTGSQAGFIYLAATGTITDFNSDGVFMSINGLTEGVDKLLSFDLQTLKCTIDNGDHTKYLVLSREQNIIYHDATEIAVNGRMAKFHGSIAAPAMPDGQGLFEITANLTGENTLALSVTSTWLNVPDSSVMTAGENIFLHSDGIWEAASGALSGAFIGFQKYQAILTHSNFAAFNIWNFNITQIITALIEVNDPVNLGFRPGTNLGTDEVGTIPLYTTGYGAVKYVYVYPNPAS